MLKNYIGVITRVPLDEGSLTGNITPNTVFPKGDWRNSYWRGDRKRQVYNRVQVLEQLLVKSGIAGNMPEAALRFCISQPAVSTVIPGMRKVQHVESNCTVSDKGPLHKGVLNSILIPPQDQKVRTGLSQYIARPKEVPWTSDPLLWLLFQ